jgi:hypothetical protein
VIGDQIEKKPETVLRRVIDQSLGFLHRPEPGIDRPIIGHVVSAVAERRHIPRVDPDGIDPKRPDVAQTRAKTGDVAGAITVAICERAEIDLIDDRLAPPGRLWGHPTIMTA